MAKMKHEIHFIAFCKDCIVLMGAYCILKCKQRYQAYILSMNDAGSLYHTSPHNPTVIKKHTLFDIPSITYILLPRNALNIITI